MKMNNIWTSRNLDNNNNSNKIQKMNSKDRC